MSSTTTPGSVVVGVDFSKDNAAAVDYAAAVATRRHLPLELLYAVEPQSPPPTYLALSMAEIREEAKGELADEADAVRQDNPGLQVSRQFAEQSPTDALVAASNRARLRRQIVIISARVTIRKALGPLIELLLRFEVHSRPLP